MGGNMALNCWEVKKCGREPGGAKVAEFGVCPASTEAKYNGTNNGKNAGRYCWKIGGTLCGNQVQGNWAQKMENCLKCEFFLAVKKEEASACKV
jgi:hypothetical protein